MVSRSDKTLLRTRVSAITLTVLAHAGVCALLAQAGPIAVGPGTDAHVVTVAVLETHHTKVQPALPKLHLARPAALHIVAPVLPISAPPQVAAHAAGAGSITLPQNKTRSGKALQDYPARVSLALAEVKRYPFSERMAHHQGRVWLRLKIAADGSLQNASLWHSSGFTKLDQTALFMAHLAAPFPAVPSGKSITLSVPVTFSLNA